MIELQPYNDLAAHAVFSALDPHDLIEAGLMRGGAASHLAIFADWHAMQANCVLSLVLRDKRRANQPFAVLALGNTGQAGVAQAALLARKHRRHARALVAACRQIRAEMPAFCADLGIRRVEARAHDGHPRASRFLQSCGFAFETDMSGFGGDGRAVFRQFAWTDPNCLSRGD